MAPDIPSLEGAFALARSPRQIAFGLGTLPSLANAVRPLGGRVAAFVDPAIAAGAHMPEIEASLSGSGLPFDVITDVPAELPTADVEHIASRVEGCDIVVAIGGGSTIDLGKLVALLIAHPGPLSGYYGENRVPGPVPPVVAVPTTAGTGSEVTPVAVVSDPDRELKVGISSPHLIPLCAIVDPLLTLGAPATVAAYAGIDAFVHAVESLTAAPRRLDWAAQADQPIFVGRNRLSSLLALEAAAVIGAHLPRAVHAPMDLPSHEAMAWGSLLAGMAFGTAGTHLSHALQYPVGAVTHTPHGLGTGMLLPHVLRACAPTIGPELALLAGALGVSVQDPAEAPAAAIEAVAALVETIGVPASLQAIGVERAALGHLAELAMSATRLVDNAPVPVTPELLTSILSSAFDGAPTTDPH